MKLLGQAVAETLLGLSVASQILFSGLARGLWVPAFRPGEIFFISLTLLALLSTQRRPRLRQIGPVVGVTALLLLSVVPAFWYHVRVLHTDALGELLLGGFVWKMLWISFVGAYVGLSPDGLKRFFRPILWSIGIASLVSFLQFERSGIVERMLGQWVATGHYREAMRGVTTRASGLAGNWHTLGFQIVLVQPVLVWYWTKGTALRSPLEASMLTILYLLGLTAVHTLTSVVLSVLGWMVFGAIALGYRPFSYGRVLRVALTVSLVVGVAVLGFLYMSFIFAPSIVAWLPRSFRYRVGNWVGVFVPLFVHAPLLGLGTALPDLFVRSEDSQYVFLAVRYGLVGLGAWLSALGVAIWKLGVGLRRGVLHARERMLSIYAMFSIVIAWVGGIVQSFANYAGVLELLWMVVVLAMVQSAQRRQDAGHVRRVQMRPTLAN